jgi:hypothetical protein
LVGDLSAGDIITVTTTGLGDPECENADTLVEILSTEGASRVTNDDDADAGTLCSNASWVVENDGLHYARVTAADNASEFPYALTISVE